MKRYLLSLTCCVIMSSLIGRSAVPQLSIVLVIDQCAYHYITNLKPFFRFGLKMLLDKSIVYENAYHPHGLPATATGHVAFNTGTYAHYHGVVNNAWVDHEGIVVQSDEDCSPDAAVFSPTGVYDYGKSAQHIVGDGVSDQVMLADHEIKTDVFSIALKSRAAIGMAGKLGKAIWFDTSSRRFTSSKAYFSSLPAWVVRYNKKSRLDALKTINWRLCYPRNSLAYKFHWIDNYTYAGFPPRAGRRIPVSSTADQYVDALELNPMGNKIVFDLALQCIKTHFSEHPDHNLLLWVSLSSLDLVGHKYGPDCLETIDMIYHTDQQIKGFMRHVDKEVGNGKSLWVLTADHGIARIPELMNQQGLPAQRLFIQQWIPEINNLLAQSLSIENLIHDKWFAPYLYLNGDIFDALNANQKSAAYVLIKEYLMGKKGIKKVWTYEELASAVFPECSFESFFKQQLYPGRSGQLIIQTDPHYQLTDYTTGTDHCTPYESNTHVPLMIYWPGVYENLVIEQKVWTLQLANTLASMLNVSKPAASLCDILPGIDRKNDDERFSLYPRENSKSL